MRYILTLILISIPTIIGCVAMNPKVPGSIKAYYFDPSLSAHSLVNSQKFWETDAASDSVSVRDTEFWNQLISDTIQVDTSRQAVYYRWHVVVIFSDTNGIEVVRYVLASNNRVGRNGKRIVEPQWIITKIASVFDDSTKAKIIDLSNRRFY